MRALILAPFSEPQLARLRLRADVIYESWIETKTLQDPQALGERLAREDLSVLVVEADFVFEELFEAAPCLRVVGVCRNALNHVDLDAATAHGVAVVHAPGRNTNAVAEMTLGLMLALARRIPDAGRLVAGGGWQDPTFGYRAFRGREIAGSAVGIVGFGKIGRAVGRLCGALCARVVVHDPLVPEAEIRAAGASPAALVELASASDFVTIHVPDADSTRNLIGTEFLAAMKHDAYLVNTSGGSVVDAAALTQALEAGTIAGAALDVFDGQPLPGSSPLMTAPNLILTPHIAGATAETVERHSRMIVDEIERWLAGAPLQHVVNPGYRTARAR